MTNRIDLESLKNQLNPLINERRINEIDLTIGQTMALIDIAESLRVICGLL